MHVHKLFPLLFLSLVMTATAETKPALKTAFATFGGGCFWCTEAVFEMLPGVKAVVSGYAGGKTVDPSYEDICTGRTGHAEVIQVEYWPHDVSYERLVEVFFEAHDPTTLNRQGADEGTQYRSVIFWHDEAQKAAAEKGKAAAQVHFDDPIVTEISPLTKFDPAEKYHQDYFRNNPGAGYCTFVIKPKVSKLMKKGVIGK